MRFLEMSALAAAIGGAAAQQAPAQYGPVLTSATTTYYTTLTVLRVETTVTATRNGTTATYESTMTETTLASATPSVGVTIPGYGNSTAYGTGAFPTSTYVPPPSPGAAGKVGVEGFGVAALAGIVGLLAL